MFIIKANATRMALRARNKLMELQGMGVSYWFGHEPFELLKSGEVTMSTCFSGRAVQRIIDGEPELGIIWDGQVIESEYFGIMAASKNKDQAKKFVYHTLSLQENLFKYIAYPPMWPTARMRLEMRRPFLRNSVYLPDSINFFKNQQTAVYVDVSVFIENYLTLTGTIGSIPM